MVGYGRPIIVFLEPLCAVTPGQVSQTDHYLPALASRSRAMQTCRDGIRRPIERARSLGPLPPGCGSSTGKRSSDSASCRMASAPRR